MNPMTNVKNIKKLSEEELKGKNKTSWHEQYRGSAWIFVGGLPYDLTEGDIICVFSQYGEIVNINLVRDKDNGKSKGFCFICFEDQRSTDLSVDNLNGIKILGRTIRVDHVEKYKPPKFIKDEKSEKSLKERENINKKDIIKNEIDTSSDNSLKGEFEPSRKLKRKKKHKRKVETDSDESQRKKKDKKVVKVEKKKKKKYKDSSNESEDEKKKKRKKKDESSDSESSLSPSDISRKSKNNRCQKQKRNRTIEDLKREAKLIQEELKRRQRLDRQGNKSPQDGDVQQQLQKQSREPRGGSSGKDRKHGYSTENRQDRLGSGKEEKRMDRSKSTIGHTQKVSGSHDKYWENGTRHQY